MTKETKTKVKEGAKTVAFDWVLILLSIEVALNHLFEYWATISPFLGENSAFVYVPAFILRMGFIGWKFYRKQEK